MKRRLEVWLGSLKGSKSSAAKHFNLVQKVTSSKTVSIKRNIVELSKLTNTVTPCFKENPT